MRGALLVAGTTSDAGKSVLVAGLCRMLARRGVRVAPFKAQNMSNNSVVTLDGGEIGRAQALQARACGLEPSVRFNPVLLKPGSDRTSQLVVRGKAMTTVGARDYMQHRQWLRAVVAEDLESLRSEFDVVICEGAGSPPKSTCAQRILPTWDWLRLRRFRSSSSVTSIAAAVLAHLFGTVAVLSPSDQALIAGFVINKFRGDVALLEPGLEQLRSLTGRPTLGVIPFADDLWLDAEDSLGVTGNAPVGRPGPPVGSAWLTVAAVRLPRISNSTDVEALACEPGVAVSWVTDPSRIRDADLVVIPGSKSTVSDLEWLRSTGLADEIVARAGRGQAVLGICGGYQMLGNSIVDDVESGSGTTAGLGLLDLDVEFAPDKVLAQMTGTADGISVSGYEIHHGRVVRNGDHPLLADSSGMPEGSVRGPVRGTHWHGLLESDDFRRSLLRELAVPGFVAAPDTAVAAVREQQLDLLADLVEQHLDQDLLEKLINGGAPIGLPVIASALEA